MILQALYELYDRLADDPDYRIAPPGYSLQKVSFRVVLTPNGDLVEIQDVREASNGSLRSKQQLVPGKAKPSGSGLNPCTLWDNSGYMLGYKADDEKVDRTLKSFTAFREKHLGLESEIGSRPFSAVCRFLENWDPASAPDYPVLDDGAKTGFGVFQIQGESKYVHEDAAFAEWWAAETSAGSEAPRGQCLVTGREGPLARLHDKTKGVKDAQSGGAAIVSFNEDAYESYGKKQSFNAPVSEDVAFRYVTALNALLDGPMSDRHRFTLGDTTAVFWTDRPTNTEDIFARFASEGSAVGNDPESQDEGLRQSVAAFLTALRKGRPVYGDFDDDPDRTPYFILGLAPNAARISVRFFHRGTVTQLLDSLRHHHADIGMTRRTTGGGLPDPEFPPAWLLLRQTAREQKDVPPVLGGTLLRSIITGSPYPEALYTAVLRRIQAERRLNYARACVIKGFLNRNLKKGVTVSLDPSRTDAAYRVGRLFAALEKTQKDALGEGLNKTIRDSFYGSASVTPGTVFPRLLRTYQHHLAKLGVGRRIHREKLVQEILEPLARFPDHLPLADQGMFAIGYYHQMRDFYTKRADDGEKSADSEGSEE